MRKLILALGLVAAALPAGAVSAQGYGRGYHNREVRQERRECRRELRRADNRREFLSRAARMPPRIGRSAALGPLGPLGSTLAALVSVSVAGRSLSPATAP